MTEEQMLERLRVEGDQPAPMFDVRQCQRPGCNQALVRRPKEKPNRFALRKFCSQECNQAVAKANLRVGQPRSPERECERPGCEVMFSGRRRQRFCSLSCAGRAADPVGERHCGYRGCGQVLVRKPGERLSDFRKRKFCSVSCGNRNRLGHVDEQGRVCARNECGQVLVRREGEAHTMFARRLFCSRECASGARAGVPRPSHAAPPRKRRKTVVVKAPPGLTVFGDKPPAEPWRPGSWRSAS